MIRQAEVVHRRGRRERRRMWSAFSGSRRLLRLLTCVFLFLPALAFGNGDKEAAELVARANRLYGEEKYDKAELVYRDAQKVLPESPEINFNLGAVFYQQENYDEAEEYFSKVLESADASRKLRKRALYNLGNCAFKKGDKLLDSDLQKALESYRLSILRYQDVISRDEFAGADDGAKKDTIEQDARFNIGVARLKIKDILDKLKQQEEQRKEQQKQQEEFIKKLQEAIQKQSDIVKDTGEADDRQKKGEDVSQSVEEISERQGENKKATNELTQELQQRIEAAQAQPQPNGQSPPPVDENALAAEASLKNAEIEQGTALQHLDRENLKDARENQEAALQNLQEALEKLTKPQHAQPQPQQDGEQEQKDQKEQQQQEQEKKGEQKSAEDQKKMSPEEAHEELAKLRKETSEARREMLKQLQQRYPQYRPEKREYEPVDKDW